MKNFAMLYKMKKALREFEGAWNQLDEDWKEWIGEMPVSTGNEGVTLGCIVHDNQHAFNALENVAIATTDIMADPKKWFSTVDELRELLGSKW